MTIKLGNVPDWHIVRLKNGKFGVVRWEHSIGKSVSVQFVDKTAMMINSEEIVEIVVGYQELVFRKLNELERSAINSSAKSDHIATEPVTSRH